MTEQQGARWFVSGRVQGVGFRYFVRRAAEPLGLVGWVRNLPDGRVEVVGSGSREAVAELHSALARGPRFARVDNVEMNEIPHDVMIPNSFIIK